MTDVIVREDESVLDVLQKTTLLPGFTTWKNPKNGFTIIDLETKADVHKRSDEWRLAQAKGMPKSQFNREYGSSWVVYAGKPVYQDFDEGFHIARGTIVVPRFARLIAGWDVGPNDVNIAWCLGVTGRDSSVLIIDEVYVDNGDMYGLCETAQEKLQLEWNKLGGFAIDLVDQAAFTKSKVVREGRAMADVMREYGFQPQSSPEQAFGKRRNNVERLMTSLYKSIDGTHTPKFRVHERCELLIAALNGGYAYPEMSGGRGGEFNPRPLKNRYSHIANAMEYLCSGLSLVSQRIAFQGKALPKLASSF